MAVYYRTLYRQKSSSPGPTFCSDWWSIVLYWLKEWSLQEVCGLPSVVSPYDRGKSQRSHGRTLLQSKIVQVITKALVVARYVYWCSYNHLSIPSLCSSHFKSLKWTSWICQWQNHVVVFQDFLTKWPLALPVPDQKAIRLVRLLTEEVASWFGLPEASLSDCGTNLLSHLMLDVCKELGVHKLNTTAYHPQCDGMIECFNRTLKTALHKHADTYGCQWDHYLFAYRNIPHDLTGEKP